MELRQTIIAVAAVALIVGAGTYGWLHGSTPADDIITNSIGTPDERRPGAASQDAPRGPRGALIIITPPPEPEITGSVKPAAKAKKRRPQDPSASAPATQLAPVSAVE